MQGEVFVGRTRPLWKIVLYSILTLGIYGRVHLYKSAKEIDGHEALFLDMRLWLLGVILPVGGPLVVKWRLVRHLSPMVRHDATAPPLHAGWLRAAAFIPWLPVYHALVQRHLTHHWLLHRKLADLRARAEVLEQRRATARTAEDREEIRQMEEDLRLRQEVLTQAQEAALEIRQARRARAAAEAEIRAAGGAPSALERVKRLAPLGKIKFSRRPREPEPEAETPPIPVRREPQAQSPREPESVQEAAAPAGLPPVDDPELSSAERKALKRLLAAKEERERANARAHEKRMDKARKAAMKAGEPEPRIEPLPASAPSKKEEKWQRRLTQARERRERKETKALEKQARKQSREAKTAGAAPASEAPGPKPRFGFLRREKANAPPAQEPTASGEPAPIREPEPVPEAPVEAPRPRKAAAKARAKPRGKK